jgi:hypothetical protein
MLAGEIFQLEFILFNAIFAFFTDGEAFGCAVLSPHSSCSLRTSLSERDIDVRTRTWFERPIGSIVENLTLA